MVAMTTVPAHGLYFCGYEISKRFFGENNFATHLVSGFVADMFGSLIWIPADVVKQRVQLKTEKTTFSAISSIMKNEGFFGFYRGYQAAIMTYGPAIAIYFAIYEYSKEKFTELNEDHKHNLAVQIFSGLLGGAVSSAVTNPLDVVKTRLQVDKSYTGVADVIRKTMKEEGIKAFGKGMFARMSWIAPSCAIGIATYEQAKRRLGLD